MRAAEFWTDAWGRRWKVSTTRGRLCFNYPAHAALRVHVHHRDGYRCVRCGVRAVAVPKRYDGRDPLQTDRIVQNRPALLLLDHMLCRAAGGSHRPENLQTLCEDCNRSKVREDVAAASARKRGH